MIIKKRLVSCRIWIHFFIGDTAGNNVWLGHYNSSGKLKRPYRDCTCPYPDMSLDNPKCRYLRLEDMRYAKKRKLDDVVHGNALFHTMSKHDIRNVLTDPDLPLSDEIHGPYRMMPPELLHTSGSGLIIYMFKSLREMFGTTTAGMAEIVWLDKLHKRLSVEISHPSERDLPRGSFRNGVLDITKCQSHERIGNLFRLLCLAHTTSGRKALMKYGWGDSARRRKSRDHRQYHQCYRQSTIM